MKHFLKGLKNNWQGTAVIAAIWLILGWLYSFGIRAVFLIPLNYLTGAIAGIDGGNIIGAGIGKVILMVFINGFITTLIVYKGTFKEKVKEAGKHFGKALRDTVPYLANFARFDFKKTGSRWMNIAGMGFGLIVYSFITGNGEFVNSFVCLVLFFAIVEEVVEKRGLLTAVLNFLLSKMGKSKISREPAEYFINGYGIGMLLSIVFALVLSNCIVSYCCGAVLFLLGALMYWWKRVEIKKEAALCEES